MAGRRHNGAKALWNNLHAETPG